jgi:hypothetical protein
MFQAIGSNLIVKVIYPQKASSIVIPTTAVKYQKYDGEIRYEVESVGSKSMWRHDIKKGDFINIQKNEGFAMGSFEGFEYRRVADKWVMGIEQ